jgi:hypothetical protein
MARAKFWQFSQNHLVTLFFSETRDIFLRQPQKLRRPVVVGLFTLRNYATRKA